MMTEEDRFIVNTILASCGKALEAYQRRLVSANAPFDRYVAGDRGALGSSAKRGLKLFVGKAACDACHQEQTFTDQEFHNTGVTQMVTPMDLGHFADLPRLEDVFNGAGVFSDDRTVGAAKLDSIARAQAEEMKGQYRTKSLRHVAQTAPYFHHGSMRTLVDVVRFYNDGGGAEGSYPGVKDERLVPLNLTEPEILDLVAFLEALTGDPVPEDLTRSMAALAPDARLVTHITAD
jgi:cytochrome c peroxidase